MEVQAAASMRRRDRQRVPTIDDIIGAVADQFGVDRETVTSEMRTARVAHIRHVAMYVARAKTYRSFQAIAAAFGYQDHGTVVYAFNKIATAVARDPKVAADVLAIEYKLAQGRPQ